MVDTDNFTLQVYPSVEKLSTIATVVHCTEEGCKKIFSSGSNLGLHLAKTHKKQCLKPTDDYKKQYHCPETKCIYNNNLSFKNMKLLKQHFLKVHAEKKFLCDKCQKGFPTASALKRHADYCGVVFACKDCNVTYPCYETLKTHCRRKKHSVIEKIAYKTGSLSSVLQSTQRSDSNIHVTKKILLPKTGSIPILIMPLKNMQDTIVEKSTQTDIVKNLLKLKNKDQAVNKKLQVCVETQTVSEYNDKKQITEKRIGRSEELRNRISKKTQTDCINCKNKSSKTKTTLNDIECLQEPTALRSSSGTQTCETIQNEFLYLSRATTDTNIYFNFEPKEQLNAFDPAFFNCNSETQTDLFGNEFFNDCEYYSNMCTQTCDDVFLGDLGLNNSHTQTAFDDVVRSVESQTMTPQNRRLLLSCKDMANMETQTDLELIQMLEEINA